MVLYHHITNRSSSLVDRLAVSTRPTVFEAHMRKMARDYEIVGLDTVLSGSLPRRALLITFDDGYRSFVDVALPVLRRLGLPSVLFVTGSLPRALLAPARQPPLVPLRGRRPERPGSGARPCRCPTRHVLTMSSTMVASMPYDRRLAVGDELAERFEVDQASLRAEAGIFLDAKDLARLAAMDARSRTTLAVTSSAERSSTRRPPTMNWSSMLAGSNP